VSIVVNKKYDLDITPGKRHQMATCSFRFRLLGSGCKMGRIERHGQDFESIGSRPRGVR